MVAGPSAGSGVGANARAATGLATLQHAVDELRAGLQALRGSFQHVTNVLQGEQERATAIEAAAAADRTRLEALESGLRDSKLRDEHHLHTVHGARKDICFLEARLQEVCDKLREHEDRLTYTGSQILDLNAGATSNSECVGALRKDCDALSERVQLADIRLNQQALDLGSLQETVSHLDAVSSATVDHLHRLDGAHGETSGCLQRTLDGTIAPALEQAERERARLDAADARIAALEAQGRQVLAQASQLEDAGAGLGAELHGLQGQMEAALATLSGLMGAVQQAAAQAKADREWLQDAWRNIDQLAEGARESSADLLRARAEAKEATTIAREQADLGERLAGTLEALRHGLAITDGEVQDLRVLLDVAPLDS